MATPSPRLHKGAYNAANLPCDLCNTAPAWLYQWRIHLYCAECIDRYAPGRLDDKGRVLDIPDTEDQAHYRRMTDSTPISPRPMLPGL